MKAVSTVPSYSHAGHVHADQSENLVHMLTGGYQTWHPDTNTVMTVDAGGRLAETMLPSWTQNP